jgi:hypothetical protein
MHRPDARLTSERDDDVRDAARVTGGSAGDREGFAGISTFMAPDDDGDGLALVRARGVGVGVGVGVGDGARLVRLGAGVGAGVAGRRALGRSSPDLPAFDVWRP